MNLNYGALQTALFKNIISSEDEMLELFEDIYNEMVVYENSRESNTVVQLDNGAVAERLKAVYKILYRHYRNSQIAYTNYEDFLDAFIEVTISYIPNYIYRKSRYEQLLSLSASELVNLGHNIRNYVDHTNTLIDDPLNEVIATITNQETEAQKGDTFARIKLTLNNARLELNNELISKYSDLFLKIGSTSVWF